jgi:hypothetical protein
MVASFHFARTFQDLHSVRLAGKDWKDGQVLFKQRCWPGDAIPSIFKILLKYIVFTDHVV